MKFYCVITAYDVLDQIAYSCGVKQYGDYEHDSPPMLWVLQGMFPGIGADRSDEWLCQLVDELSSRL